MPTNRPYLSLIQHSVTADGVTFEEISANYLYRAIMNDKSFLMHDVEVGLNNSAAAKVSMSKSGTYATLHHAKVPAVEHFFLMNTNSRFNQTNSIELARKLFDRWNKTVVIKQDNGSQGNNVFKVSTLHELEERLQFLFDREVHASISPYKEATYEYRIVMLNRQPRLFLAKERTTSWKHNLISGAKSIDVTEHLIPQLSELAKNATEAVELEFCTVDILDTTDGLFVLEVNEQVMLDEYSKNNQMRQEKVAQIYREAILTRFNLL